MKGFLLEWQKILPLILGKKITSIYFGGGTPSLMGPEAIFEIISWVKKSFSITQQEITLEANPENITVALMKAYKDAGINRISIGIQTFDDALLKRLDRTHDSKTALKAIEETHRAQFDNISIDLMYDLPGQNIQIWQDSLNKVKSLPISHLSLYNLTIEPHTLFFKYRHALSKEMPDENESVNMYLMAQNLLTQFGFSQYEISAFAKNGQISKHNTGYWQGRPFLGFGPSAFSYFEGKRFRNIANLNRYVDALEKHESPIDFEEQLAPEASERELLAIGLRMLEGVNLSFFQEKYGHLDPETLKNIYALIQEGYLQQKDNLISLSQKGILFYDTVASEIV